MVYRPAREGRLCEHFGGYKLTIHRIALPLPHGLAWLLYRCVALWRAIYGHSTAERPLGTIREEKGISSLFQVFD